MPVATAIVAYAYMCALVTRIYMTTERSRAALLQQPKRFLLLCIQVKLRKIGMAQYIRYFPLRLHNANTLSKGLCGN
jgi:hypothetical protein